MLFFYETTIQYKTGMFILTVNQPIIILTHLFIDATMPFQLICRFELLCQIMISVTRDSNRSSSPPKYASVLRELPDKLIIYENP